MKAQRDRLTGLAEAFSTPRSGPVGTSGIIVGGPTYRQTATPADQDAALRSQLAAAQEAGDVYLDENTGQIIGDSALMRNQMDDPMAERIGGAKLSVPDELDAVDYDTVSQFINEGLGSGKKESGIISDDTSVDGADTKESDSDPLLMTGTAEQDVGTTDGTAGSGGTTQQKKQTLYGGLLKQSLDSYNDMIGNAPSAAKTIEEYKQEFSEATGIDISGQPDNSAALTAFGLALMQNKAGKGFNVGELLSETGKAGEKALPLMAEARKEAKQGQIAAGQFALAQRATDTATRQKYLNEAETYIRGRRDAILGAEVARIQTIEDREDKQAAAKELERVKYGYDYNLKKIDAFKEISKDQFKVENVKDLVPLTNLPNLKITYGKSEVDGSPRLLYPAQQVGQLGTALADIKEGQGSIDYMIGELELIKDQPGGINLQKAKEIAQGLTQSFGYTLDAVPQFNDKGEYCCQTTTDSTV